MLCTIGDLLEDVVVRLSGPPNVGSDVDASVTRHRGGSAANVAVHAARRYGRARFVGQVGADEVGDRLVAQLRDDGVDPVVRRAGTTGAIVALVDPSGQRTMLSDRGVAPALEGFEMAWLDGVEVLHVPAYSLVVEPLSTTAGAAIDAARARGLRVTIDASSSAVLRGFGTQRFLDALEMWRPDVLFASVDEAEALGIDARSPVGAQVTIVTRGAEPTLVLGPHGPITQVAVPPAEVVDTTGAGDAFVAGVLTADTDQLTDAIEAGHRAAASVITHPGAG